MLFCGRVDLRLYLNEMGGWEVQTAKTTGIHGKSHLLSAD